jgi:hypothetical protein
MHKITLHLHVHPCISAHDMRRPPQPLRAAISRPGDVEQLGGSTSFGFLFFRRKDGQEYIGYCDVSGSPWLKASSPPRAHLWITIEAHCMIACVGLGEVTRRSTFPFSNSPSVDYRVNFRDFQLGMVL